MIKPWILDDFKATFWTRVHHYGKSTFFIGKLYINGDFHGKSTCLLGKSTISMAMFNSFLYVYRRVSQLFRQLATPELQTITAPPRDVDPQMKLRQKMATMVK